jgi:WhiB family redox-sensing transcriptional regulator
MDLHIDFDDVIDVPKWYKDAACKGHENQDDFFPERGSSTVIAKRICNGCPVREECLEYAVERKERFGIWGGKSERERRAIRRERRKKT